MEGGRERMGEGGREKERKKEIEELGNRERRERYLPILFKINRGVASPRTLIWQKPMHRHT